MKAYSTHTYPLRFEFFSHTTTAPYAIIFFLALPCSLVARKELATEWRACERHSWQFTSSHEPCNAKKGRPLGRPFLAQKTRFELVLRFSHTTPLAGEPLEPLGYFCMAQYSKAILLYHIFFALSKLFALKNKKSSQIFLKRLTESRLSFIIPYVKIF